MKLSYKWLQELTSTKKSPEKLAELLNMHVGSVEKVEDLSKELKKIVVGEIIEIKPHPSADKLQLVQAKTLVGNKTKKFEVVCGALNIAVGQKVPLALAGARLADGSILKASTIRGVKSAGMLCAEDELGIGDDHTGIYILDSKAKLGRMITSVLGLDDFVFEIENSSISHRPDLFNHYGFSREISAITNSKFKIKNSELRITNKKLNKSKQQIKIKIEDKKLCPRYMAVVMDNITIAPSPEWMQSRLRSLGIRPINNVVDISNYVMMELGQPLHTFDKDKISQGIIVRRGKKGEKLLALDGKKYNLITDDIVIADSKGPIAIAGVMGGEVSGVNELTKTIIIESANFNPVSVRRTSWRLGLRTDSVLRFEKGLPLDFAKIGLLRAIELIQEIARGRVVNHIYDEKSVEASRRLKYIRKIDFDFNKARTFIGSSEIENKEMTFILKQLGCDIKTKENKIKVSIPVHRTDLTLFEDLVEEIVRIYGAEKITPSPVMAEITPPQVNPKYMLEKELKNILVACGFDEVYNYSFYSKEDKNNIFSSGKHLEIENPLNPNQQYLRMSLIPGLIKNAEKNDPCFSEFKLFEIGNVFALQEKKKIAGLIRGEEKELYFVIKGVIELIFDRLGIDMDKIKYREQQSSITDIAFGKTRLGSFGLVRDAIGVFELDFKTLLRLRTKAKLYSLISQYPPIKRDLAFLIDNSVLWGDIIASIKNINSLINKTELFDVYKSKRFGNKRNIAFHIIYQSSKRTLTVEEVDKIQKKIIKTLEKKFKAQLRNF